MEDLKEEVGREIGEESSWRQELQDIVGIYTHVQYGSGIIVSRFERAYASFKTRRVRV